MYLKLIEVGSDKNKCICFKDTVMEESFGKKIDGQVRTLWFLKNITAVIKEFIKESKSLNIQLY